MNLEASALSLYLLLAKGGSSTVWVVVCFTRFIVTEIILIHLACCTQTLLKSILLCSLLNSLTPSHVKLLFCLNIQNVIKCHYFLAFFFFKSYAVCCCLVLLLQIFLNMMCVCLTLSDSPRVFLHPRVCCAWKYERREVWALTDFCTGCNFLANYHIHNPVEFFNIF